jgi:hypothetical protein
MGMISWFRYVPYGDLLLAMVYGWQPIADLGVAEVGPAPSRSSVAGWSWQDAGGR